jgi:hypothetical protein
VKNGLMKQSATPKWDWISKTEMHEQTSKRILG